MSMWGWILTASAVAFATKLAGYLLPRHWLAAPVVQQVFAAMTIGLLASLVGLNTFSSGHSLVLDARMVALVVAALALWRRAPFLLVVVLGAAAAALARLTGLP